MYGEVMRERVLLLTIVAFLSIFLYVFQYHVNTGIGFVILCAFMLIYGVYMNLATRHKKRKLEKQPVVINENYKPFVSVLIPAHNEEGVITSTVENILGMDYDNFEIIVIDDRSSDRTPIVIKQLEEKYPKVHALIRPHDAYPGKSAVLNDAFKLAKGEAVLIFDADATVESDFLKKLLPELEPSDVGAVQARKVIRNKDENFLTRCQNNEYTFDCNIQAGRDSVKGAVELRGNGELIKRAALEDIGGWNNDTITDDLDMSTRLHIKGWDVRFCVDAVVYEEGVIYLIPLYRQRRRWLEGSIRRYLEYFWDAFNSKKMSLKAQTDMFIFILQFIMPLWFLLEVCFRTIKFIMGKVGPNEFLSSGVIAAVMAVGFICAIRYSLRRYDNTPRLRAVKEACETTIYMLIIWFPMVLFILGKIVFLKKDMKWGKTTHGLVMEKERTIMEKLKKIKKELQEV